LRAQFDMSRIRQYQTQLTTDASIAHACHMTRTLVGSDEESTHMIEQYVRCFIDVVNECSDTHSPTS
jgi:hypothetical protein